MNRNVAEIAVITSNGAENENVSSRRHNPKGQISTALRIICSHVDTS